MNQYCWGAYVCDVSVRGGGIESPLGYRISCFIRLYAFPPVYVKRAALRKTDGSVLGAKAKKIIPKSLIRKSKLRVIFSYQILIVWVVIPCSFVGNTNNPVLSNNGVTQRYNTIVKRLERSDNDGYANDSVNGPGERENKNCLLRNRLKFLIKFAF